MIFKRSLDELVFSGMLNFKQLSAATMDYFTLVSFSSLDGTTEGYRQQALRKMVL